MTVTKMPDLTGQFLIAYILGKLVEQVCECQLLLQQNIQTLPPGPYVTYTIVTPEQEQTSDWLGSDRQYTCHFQIDVHADQMFVANDLCTKLNAALHDDGYRRWFKQGNVLPQSITNSSNRTVLQGINYDNDLGFDCVFVINGTHVYQPSDFDFTYTSVTIDHIDSSKQTTVTPHGDITG